jgi:hypothetical protein
MLMRRPEQADAANRRITGAPGIQEARQDPGDEDDGDTEQDPEMGGSGWNSRWDGRCNRSYRARPWPFRPRPGAETVPTDAQWTATARNRASNGVCVQRPVPGRAVCKCRSAYGGPNPTPATT